ncbi:unnamed protein product, partial [Allacma fusca]
MSGYDESHWTAAKNVLRYLKQTSGYGINYKSGGDMELKTYTDSDYAGCKISRKSTSGMLVFLNNALISWTSQKQPCVALSSTEAEYIAVSSGARESVWLRSLIEELGYPQTQPTRILVDNQSAIKLVKNPEMHSRTKHIQVRYHYIRELVEDEQVSIEYVHTSDQLADGLTKPLLKGKLEHNRSRLGIEDNSMEGSRVQNKGKSLGMALYFAAVLMLFTLCAVPSSASLDMAPVLWRKSETPITTGHHQINLQVNFINPCDILMNDTIHHELVEDAHSRCQNAYETNFMQELRQMCPQKRWTSVANRKKRFVDLVLALI